MSDDAILYETASDIATITINRPAARNAINRAVRDGLFTAFDSFCADDSLRVAILTGAGDRAFSAGADLKEMSAAGTAEPGKGNRGIPHLGRNIACEKPVIAAVNGFALAGGFLFAQMCDLCVAADSAQFGISEAKWSRGAPWAGPLPWMIPPRVAMELILTAEPISAQRAHEIGLVNKIVPAADLMNEANAMARTIADNAPLSVKAGKEMIYRSLGLDWSKALEMGDDVWREVYLSDDAQEGPKAFAERRAPTWKGH